MKKYIGLWVDSCEACIVTYLVKDSGLVAEADPFRPQIEYVKSDIEKHACLSGGSRQRKTPWGPENVSDDKNTGRRRAGEKSAYFQEIIPRLKDADRILIFGPGEAKTELSQEIRRRDQTLASKMFVETTDKMTESKIVARIRNHYGL